MRGKVGKAGKRFVSTQGGGFVMSLCKTRRFWLCINTARTIGGEYLTHDLGVICGRHEEAQEQDGRRLAMLEDGRKQF